MCEKIRAATASRRDRDFLIIARTDARAVEGMESAIERAAMYAKAGADAIFPEALQTPAEFREFAKRIKVPLLANMTEFGKSPLLSVRQLASMGYRMVIFPQTAFRIAMRAEEKALEVVKRRGTQQGLVPQMQTREELYELLEYDPAEEEWPVRRRSRKN
jgi:methylisocitrate lyase